MDDKKDLTREKAVTTLEGPGDEYGDGTFIRTGCPHCGRFFPLPKTYRAHFFDGSFIGCWGISVCVNCRKRNRVHVEFI